MPDIVPEKRSKTERFQEALLFDKAKDFNPLALQLVDSKMRKAIAAWPFVERIVEEPEDGDDAWSFVRYNPFEWMNLAGLETNEHRDILEKLKTLGLIFADGTMPTEVHSFITR